MRDLRVYAEALDGSVSHFRDKNGLECDAVLHRRDGRYGLIEVKLGSEKGIEDGVKTLTTFSKKINTDAMGTPSFLMILTASGDFAYRRDDGILVVPIGCLKPREKLRASFRIYPTGRKTLPLRKGWTSIRVPLHVCR